MLTLPMNVPNVFYECYESTSLLQKIPAESKNVPHYNLQKTNLQGVVIHNFFGGVPKKTQGP